MKIQNASINWLETGLPYSSQFGDVYYSRDDERGESQHVFLAANALDHRWQRAAASTRTFSIAELGFGSGLNFLQVWQAWSQATERPQQLNYIAFEKYPLTASALQLAHENWPELSSLSKQLRLVYPDHSSGCHRLCLSDNVILDLYYGDAYSQLCSRARPGSAGIDAWFLDGFSPRLNPQLWETRLFQLLAHSCHSNTTLSSYSVAGKVRKNLQSAGFTVEKLPGFARKRHMLGARLAPNHCASPIAEPRPWFTLPAPRQAHNRTKNPSALIIGAGLAGCSSAYSLAQRGWHVTLCESAAELASGASGNSQLALRCRLFKQASPIAEYFLHCFLFAIRQFDQLALAGELHWRKSGVLQLQTALNKRQRLSGSDLSAVYAAAVIQQASQLQASALAGTELLKSAWFYRDGGWLNPHSLCRAYTSHPNIQLGYARRIATLSHEDGMWSAVDTNGHAVSDAVEVVIIANNYQANQFEQTSAIPLQGVRGQTTEIASNTHSEQLKLVISGQRTIFPASNNSHTVSASYSTDALDSTIDENENLQNIEMASALFADTQFLPTDITGARASVRCNSSDQLPVVGPVANVAAMQSRFAALAHNARASFGVTAAESNRAPLHHPGLYITTAHASNGLASCPLSAEYLASLINAENLPISTAATEAINPARFLIRNLKKQKPPG